MRWNLSSTRIEPGQPARCNVPSDTSSQTAFVHSVKIKSTIMSALWSGPTRMLCLGSSAGGSPVHLNRGASMQQSQTTRLLLWAQGSDCTGYGRGCSQDFVVSSGFGETFFFQFFFFFHSTNPTSSATDVQPETENRFPDTSLCPPPLFSVPVTACW